MLSKTDLILELIDSLDPSDRNWDEKVALICNVSESRFGYECPNILRELMEK